MGSTVDWRICWRKDEKMGWIRLEIREISVSHTASVRYLSLKRIRYPRWIGLPQFEPRGDAADRVRGEQPVRTGRSAAETERSAFLFHLRRSVLYGCQRL